MPRLTLNKNQKQRAKSTIGVFLLTFMLCSLLTGFTVINRNISEKLTMQQLIIVKSAKVREVLSRLTYKTEFLAALVHRNAGRQDDFELIASSIVDNPVILYVMLAPSGIVTDVYPQQYYDSRIGMDIFSGGLGIQDAITARDNNQLVLGGPYDLREGGQALLARMPVYTTDTWNGEKSFWGLISIALKYPEVLDEAGLDELQLQGYAYEIWTVSESNGKKDLIASGTPSNDLQMNYVEDTISILNANWIFRVFSLRKWYEYPEMWILIFISICISFLVTKLQITTLHAKNASKVKSTFLASMSHEIRTPMNAIIGMSELLMSENLNQKQSEYVKQINVSSTALLGIINDILDMSKIEAEKFTLNSVNFDLHQLIENISAVMSFTAKNKGLDFISEMDKSLPRYIYGDDVRLRQILVNLIGNAVKFTEDGYVRLAVNSTESTINFTVTDTGIGIKEEEIDRLYDSFEQLDRQKNYSKQGTGLGLAITKKLIDMMNGSIKVNSVYGEGTSFNVEIPFSPGDESQIINAADSSEIIASAEDVNVLIVDDNEANRVVGQGLLKLNGIECDVAVNGFDAIDKVREKDYDIIFMDHMMPEMDGIETVKKIRALGEKYKQGNLAIIALTANASSEAKKMLLSSGMDDFLSKPINRRVLSQMLKKWLPQDKFVKKAHEESTTLPETSGHDYSKVIELAHGIDGLDVELGLSHVAGIEDYERSLRILSVSIPDAISDLERFLENGEINRFLIDIHGLKGALATNGHLSLSELAKRMEDESRNNNIEFCKSNISEFSIKLKHFGDALTEIFNACQLKGNQEGDFHLLSETLEYIRDDAERYDRAGALKQLEDISIYSFGNNIDIMIEQITASLESFDYDLAVELIDKTHIAVSELISEN